jgi:hypothetical protein
MRGPWRAVLHKDGGFHHWGLSRAVERRDKSNIRSKHTANETQCWSGLRGGEAVPSMTPRLCVLNNEEIVVSLGSTCP